MPETVELISFRNIKKIKNLEASVLENIPIGLIAIDLEEIIRVFNRSAADMFNIIPVTPSNAKLNELLDPNTAALLQKVYHHTLKTRAIQKERVIRTSPEGLNLSIDVTGILWKDLNDADCGVLVQCQQITENNNSIFDTKVDNLKNHFLSSISHEFRTPLTAIKNFAEILVNEEEKDKYKQKEYLQIIAKESERINKLITNMLELSKIEAGLADWNMSVLHLPDVIELAIDSVKAISISKNISIEYQPPNFSPLVLADRDKLIQVFNHLLNNAIKFTEKGGKITITQEILKGKRGRDTTDFLRIAVRDWGSGISNENLQMIFNKFYQAGNALTEKPQGTGLGLAISKVIIKHLGGNMWVKSELGKGSTFYFTIPILSEVKNKFVS